MDVSKMISKAVKAGTLYNLSHFHQAWNNVSLRRLMGNELLFPPSPAVINAVEKVLPKMNYYPEDPATNRQLLQALAEYAGVAGGADWVTLGNGSMEIIDMLPRAFLNEGDEVLLPCPDYTPYTRRPPLYGGVIVDVIPDKKFCYTLEDFTSRLTNKTKMIILSRPNAPAGNLLPRGVLRQLLDLEVIVVVDEAYAEFSRQTVVDLLPQFNNLIVSRTFSKAMGLGGIRLGFILTNPEIISFIERIRVPLNISLLTQVAALAAVSDAQYIEGNIQRVIDAREFLQKKLKQITGIHVYPSQGNFVLINTEQCKISADEIQEKLLEENYLTRNVSGGRGLAGEHFLRITIGTMEDMAAIARHINRIVDEG